MNYDINTKIGAANSVKWLNGHLRLIKEGGIWLIPRSGTAYEIRESKREAIKIMATLPDACLDQVFRMAGWKVVDNT